MNFTREPIIETVISPKDGYKLLVRSSRMGNAEEYTVDALEVVCFGSALFFRCLEKPKAFLLPVSEYEVIETKETRVVLKKAVIEKSIKIGGGKKAPQPREEEVEEPEEEKEELVISAEEEEVSPATQAVEEAEQHNRKRKRLRRRRGHEELRQPHGAHKEHEQAIDKEPAERKEEVKLLAPPPFRSILPPPSGLISEQFARSKSDEVSKKDSQEESLKELSTLAEHGSVATSSKEELEAEKVSEKLILREEMITLPPPPKHIVSEITSDLIHNKEETQHKE